MSLCSLRVQMHKYTYVCGLQIGKNAVKGHFQLDYLRSVAGTFDFLNYKIENYLTGILDPQKKKNFLKALLVIQEMRSDRIA